MAFGIFNGVYKVTTFGAFRGQQVRNVFGYRALDSGETTAHAVELAQLFTNPVVTNFILPAVMSDYVYERTEVELMTDNSIFAVEFLAATGVKTGAGLPSFVALQYRCLRPVPAYRNGYKRFPGLAAADIDNDVINDVGGELESLRQALLLALTGSLTTFQPFVAKRKLPDGGGVDGFDIDAVANPRIGSQNTRKITL